MTAQPKLKPCSGRRAEIKTLLWRLASGRMAEIKTLVYFDPRRKAEWPKKGL